MKAAKTENHKKLSRQVGEQEQIKLKARRERKRSVWSGLGMFGLVGWSVAVPTLLGAALGRWLDKNYPESFSWTITFLVLGLLTGCLIVWQWVAKEDRAMHESIEESEKDE
jgi:ATP synthase protein I